MCYFVKMFLETHLKIALTLTHWQFFGSCFKIDSRLYVQKEWFCFVDGLHFKPG